MKYYYPAHCAFFEAAIADWPTPLLEWLAEDIPSITELVPHNESGMLIKDSSEWKEIQHEAIEECLPDWCANCGHIESYNIIGGKLRDGCHRCVDTIDPNSDGYMTALMRMALVLTALPEPHYTEALVDYLVLCHVKWREQSIVPRIEVSEHKPKVSLRDKLR